MNRTYLFALFAITGGALFPPVASADTFGGGGPNSFEIEFVRIGSAGNLPDENPNPAGAVNYEYRIGKYEISEHMIEKANTLSAAAGNPLGIMIDDRGPDFPATSVTWFEAAQFVNWLNTSTGSLPAYKFNDTGEFELWLPSDQGYDANNLYRNSHAKFFLPSINEWHKAAYYDTAAGHYWDYPTGSDAVPDGIDIVGDTMFDAVFFDGGGTENLPNEVFNVGVFSPFGTSGQGGNVREFQETAFDRVNNITNEHRGAGGGSMNDSSNVMAAFNSPEGRAPLAESPIIGFRVAAVVPEPNAWSVFLIGMLWLIGLRNRSDNVVAI